MVDKVKRIAGLFQTSLTDKQRNNSELNIDEAERAVPVLESYPRRILLELTNMCNLRCIMCGRNFSKFRPSYMDIKILDKIKPLLNYSEEVTLFGWGEPTIHPEFSKIMDYLGQFSHVRKYILTNGTNLGFIKQMIKKGYIDILAISLDGATSETNDFIRKGSDFEYIVENLKEIVALKDEGYKIPFMNFVFVMMNRNIHELPKVVELANEIGIPEVKAVYLTSFHPSLDEEVLYDNDEYHKYIDEARLKAEELGILVKFPNKIGEDDVGDLNHKLCHDAWRDLFISSDGTVRACQSTSYKIGSIFEHDDFMSLWNNETFQNFRSKVNKDEENLPNCRFCYQSSHANWNRREAHIQSDMKFSPEWGEK